MKILLTALLTVICLSASAFAQSPGLVEAARRALASRTAEQWDDAAGAGSAQLGEVAAEFVMKDLAVVVFHRSLEYPAARAKQLKAEHAGRLAEVFPKPHLEACGKLFYWEGNTFHELAALALRKDRGPWAAQPDKPRDFPLPAFRKRMLREWGCNAFRWKGADAEGKDVQRLYPGEEPAALLDPDEDEGE